MVGLAATNKLIIVEFSDAFSQVQIPNILHLSDKHNLIILQFSDHFCPQVLLVQILSMLHL
jgi:hypothetical protein